MAGDCPGRRSFLPFSLRGAWPDVPFQLGCRSRVRFARPSGGALVFPAERIAFGDVVDAELAHHVEGLGAVVHAVGREVEDRATEGFTRRRVVECVEEGVVEPAFVLDASREFVERGGCAVVVLDHQCDRRVRSEPGLFGLDAAHQRGPAHGVADDVVPEFSQCAWPEREVAIELRIAERQAQLHQPAGRPGIVLEQAFEEVHVGGLIGLSLWLAVCRYHIVHHFGRLITRVWSYV